MNKVDQFYPISETMTKAPTGMWQLSMSVKLLEHLEAAKRGDRERESRLINRLGQIRRCVEFNCLTDNLKEVIGQAVEWLRSIGRTVNFKTEDPAMWITARDGKTPRW